ncbi:hypothetical protein RFI_02515 [Reticulomyxa filosa]|uniref:Uncharacterized protein n=1 Tax=Reticulomyxa filosa TaxID=46433 RepID=X6P8P9_RETFI|nr:hypothetical protein RFI_02515 [Reticulomyxa filosa]|eukprot:ETO34576.1 hypothetical protein RFI_02515 [Reticulomyxa filosa]
MEKITGIKSIDFKIVAKGHGVVNWNGVTTLAGADNKNVNNHTMPKLRGYTNLSGKIKEETGYKYPKEARDVDFKKTPLYISQNCIRHHLFREQAFDLHYVESQKKECKEDNKIKLLASDTGLLRGYVIPSSQEKRISCLLLEDFVDQLGNGNFEQFGQSGTKDESSFYSKTTFGDTQYISYGSISIEQLQFISLDRKFERPAICGLDTSGEVKAKQEIMAYIKSLSPESSLVQATLHENYVRKGSIFEEGEVGILLNNVAISVLVEHMLDKLRNLVIRQAKSYMYVDSIEVDYNDSDKMMRVKRTEGHSEINSRASDNYATYFYAKD